MKKKLIPLIAILALAACNNKASDKTTVNDSIQKQENSSTSQTDAALVTVKNFIRAETDMYFNTIIKQAGTTGKFFHYTELMPIDNQTVIRTNRDVLYSAAVFDLDAGPVTVTLPNPGKRFMSMMVTDEDHYTKTEYAPGTFTYSKDKVGTRYLMLGIRTFIDPNDKNDLQKVKDLQNAIKVDQKDKGTFDIPNWDKNSQKRIHDSLVEVSKKYPDTKGMFGLKTEVDPVRHLVGTATGWGGNTEKDAMYLQIQPKKNDGKTIYRLNVKNVPVDGFWSISVYNKEGYFQKNDLDAYSLNNITAKKDKDGSVTIQFGGCDGKVANCIPIMPDWNYWVRLYRPQKEILNGSWKFPEAQPLK